MILRLYVHGAFYYVSLVIFVLCVREFFMLLLQEAVHVVLRTMNSKLRTATSA